MTLKNATRTICYKISIFLLIAVTSCASRQDIVYFQDQPLSQTEISQMETELIYRTNDLLTIQVSAEDPAVAKPFNLPAASFSESVLNAEGTIRMQTYLVDVNGNIEFPTLGTLKLEGLTRSEANNFLKEKLADYIKDPIVNIRLANFSITVLGEVNRPGTYTIQDERISLAKALGLAGDLTIYGRRDNIFLIREVEGKKRFAKLDLTSINVVNSPLYYLAQNDVIYVEPNGAKMSTSRFNPNTAVVISAISTLATIAAILIR